MASMQWVFVGVAVALALFATLSPQETLQAVLLVEVSYKAQQHFFNSLNR